MDKNNNFISISYKNVKFIDSCRLFGGISLNDLCKLFKVDNKFESKKEWWTEDLFKYPCWYYDEFERYAEQDVFCLYKAITKAIDFYKTKFNITILNCLSTASLSYKIFKLENDHITLSGSEDSFIRKAYYGGYTNFFKFNLKRGHHYHSCGTLTVYIHSVCLIICHMK